MKCIMITYDSLNRNYLPPYGCGWVHAPNFERLSDAAATFETAYAGSLPTMPARREMHTGRYTFLHKDWGPLEPYDESMIAILRDAGIYVHLTSDSYHYWEDGGATYHIRYSSWEFFRGQEGDPWKADMEGLHRIDDRKWHWRLRQEEINRSHMKEEKDMPQSKTFAAALEFLETNHRHDGWMLHVETFDPHEPFFSPEKYRKLYPETGEEGFHLQWPPYKRVNESEAFVQETRYQYAALLSKCDASLGLILDAMDRYGLWGDTMLIVNTDHGFLLGEHGWWGKGHVPLYDELARIPLFIWDPRTGKRGVRRKSLVQTIDIPATVLDFFGAKIPETMQGKPLVETIDNDTPVRKGGLFGKHGRQVNCTDGRFVYMRPPASDENQPLFDYTQMPTVMRGFISVKRLQGAEMGGPFSFTKGCKLFKIPQRITDLGEDERKELLFDTDKDPSQQRPMDEEAEKRRLASLMVELMEESDAPTEQYERLGLK